MREVRTNPAMLAKLRYHEYFLPELRIWIEEYAATMAKAAGEPKPTEEGKGECVLCLCAQSRYAAACGHKCLCETCAKTTKCCPICRVTVAQWIKIFDS